MYLDVQCESFSRPFLLLNDSITQWFDYGASVNVVCDLGYKIVEHSSTEIDLTCNVDVTDGALGSWRVDPETLQCDSMYHFDGSLNVHVVRKHNKIESIKFILFTNYV